MPILINSFYRIEKYRPKVLSDVVGNEEIVKRLEVIAKTGNMPHILLAVLIDSLFALLNRSLRVHRVLVKQQVSCAWLTSFLDPV